jgi:hypothetical protein
MTQFLKPVEGKPRITRIFAFDIETHENNQEFTCASIVGDDYTKFFYDRESMISEITHNPIFENSQLWATNLMFDFNAIFPDPAHYLRDFSIIERQGSIVMAKTYIYMGKMFHPDSVPRKLKSHNFRPITFLDSANHLKSSVERLGDIIQIEKMQKPTFLGNKPINESQWRELKEYNLRDSLITFTFMKFLQKTYTELNCSLKITASSSAMDYFRRNNLDRWMPQEPKANILDCYKGYYGGRTEVFKRGLFQDDVKCYDVNSLYPYCLKSFPYPLPDPKHCYRKEKITHEDIENFEGVASVELKAPSLNIPFLPQRGDKLLFPVGRITGWHDFYSIRKALSMGYEIEALHEGVVYEQVYKPFVDFVTELYIKRKELQKEQNQKHLIPKLLMNSFYGKWGYKFMEKEMLGTEEQIGDMFETHSVIPTRKEGVYRFVTTENSKIPKYVFPIFSLYTTAYARAVMFDYYKKLKDDVYYTDTDSLYTSKKLETSKELGDLKEEYRFKEICFMRPKMYCGVTRDDHTIMKIKGINPTDLNYAGMMHCIESNKYNFRMNRFIKLRGSLAHDAHINSVVSITKTLNVNDNKRIWEKPTFTLLPQNSEPIVIV